MCAAGTETSGSVGSAQRRASGTLPPDRPGAPAPPVILVVDDEPAVRGMVAEALDLEGYRVVEAANGAEGLDAAARDRPRAVLLDMRMPVLDGWGFAREARRRGYAFPIVVMTAAQHPQRWADEIGAAACLSKPFDLDALYAALQRLCRAG